MSWIINYNTDGGSATHPELSPEDEYRKTLDFEIWFYEGIAKDCPDYVEVLQALGNSYTSRGYYEKGLFVDRKLATLCPADPVVFYNLACSYSLIGELDEAFKSLEQAVGLGYNDMQHMNSDPDLKTARSDPRYAEILKRMTAPKGRA